MSTKTNITLILTTITILITITSTNATAAYTGPIKLIPTSHFGREVNKTETEKHAGPLLENTCTAISNDTCQPGKESTTTATYADPRSTAVEDDPTNPDYKNIYIVDKNNNRIQEITSNGMFVRMFGWDVNETKEKEGAPQQERNTCTAISKNICKRGVAGGATEQISTSAYSIAVDRTTGNLYIEDYFDWRVDEYTSNGEFVLMIGKDVNQTTGGNICTVASHDICKTGIQNTVGDTEQGAFNFAQGSGDLLSVGGPEDLLYVGDEHRVQEFSAVTGAFKSEIPLTSISDESEKEASALAVDENGVVYVAYPVGSVANTIYVFENGVKVREFEIRAPAVANQTVSVVVMGIDSSGRLAVSENESGEHSTWYGTLYDTSTGEPITEFENPGDRGIGFELSGETDELYAGVDERQEVVAYTSVHVADVFTDPSDCVSGAEGDVSGSVAYNCMFNGHVNPEEVPGTRVWFAWGATPGVGHVALRTPTETVGEGDTSVPIGASVEGLRPDEEYYYRLVGEDNNVKEPEHVVSKLESFRTPIVPPRVIGIPSVQFVSSSSAVMFGEFNPEKTGTRYEFQYAPEEECKNLEACPKRLETTVQESAAYGEIGITTEVRSLQPGKSYRYRLMATNAQNEPAVNTKNQKEIPEATFKTEPTSNSTSRNGSREHYR